MMAMDIHLLSQSHHFVFLWHPLGGHVGYFARLQAVCEGEVHR